MKKFEELLKKLDTFCSPINTWTVCINFSSIHSVEKFLQKVDNCLNLCNDLLIIITETRERTECRALQKRDFCGKSLKSIFDKPNRRKLVDQSLQRVEQFEKIKIESELIKNEDCFLDDYGNYTST